MSFPIENMLNRHVTILVPGCAPMNIKCTRADKDAVEGHHSDGEQVVINPVSIISFWYRKPPVPRKSKKSTSRGKKMPDDSTKSSDLDDQPTEAIIDHPEPKSLLKETTKPSRSKSHAR